MQTLQASRIEPFRAGFMGDVIVRGDDGYESARRIWNAMIDRRPALIARCATVPDVVRAVTFAREQGLTLAVRGGGHDIAGNATCDDGVVVDLSAMRAARVDPLRRRVTIEAGATLAELDAATQEHGLATPVGIHSTTGIAGLTLGGGFGWLSRKYGMTVDNLVSAEIVTAAGEVLNASADQNPELFWALRGGGGNFGVVTRFEFRLHPVGPEVLSGLIVHPLTAAKSVMREYRAFMAKAPDDLSVWMVLRQAPPLPFLPERVHGTPILALALMYAGTPLEGVALIDRVRAIGRPVGEGVGVRPYTAWQQAFDAPLAAGARNYWRSHNLTTLDDGLIDVALDAVHELPTPQGEVFVAALGGATARPAPDATAYPHRDTRFVMSFHGRWNDPADDPIGIAWARNAFHASAPYASGGVHVNFLAADEGDRVRAAYGASYARLAELKRRYDPGNLLRMNHNIEPA